MYSLVGFDNKMEQNFKELKAHIDIWSKKRMPHKLKKKLKSANN
jgi:hypothetical protein